MKRLYSILTLFGLFLSISAQNISVTDFHLDQMDQDANLQGTTVIDQNGEKCALIKVITTQTGFTFDVGVLGVQKTVQKTGEIWVYVPGGIKKISLMHPQLGQLRNYPLPVAINKARTYIMDLKVADVKPKVETAQDTLQILYESALKGVAKAQNMLGMCYFSGKGVTKSYTEAVKWFEKAADQEYSPGEYNLGKCYYNGDGVEQSYDEAIELFSRAALQGNAKAMNSLGECYYNGHGVEQSEAEAIAWWKKAAKQGEKKAIEHLKNMNIE